MLAAGLAAQINAWGRRWPYAGYGVPEAPAAVPPVTFPTTKLAIRVELQLGPFGIWTDVTPYVLWRDKIRITRGRRNEQSSAPASTCALTFKNQDRRFSPRNATGPYYGMLGRNTKLRVSVNPGSGMSRRYEGRIPEWPPTWGAPNDRTVRVEASGVLRRLEQGDWPLNSPMFNTITAAGPLLYYPMEDNADSTFIASGIGGEPMRPNGTVTYAGNTNLPGSKQMIVLDATTDITFEQLVECNGQWQVDWFTELPEADLAANTILIRIFTSGSNVAFWDFVTGAGVQAVHGYAADGTLLVDSGAFLQPSWFLGQPIHLRLMVADAGGGNVQAQFVEFPLNGVGGFIPISSFAGTPGNFRQVIIGTREGADLTGVAMGHFAVYDKYDFSATDDSATGYGPDPTAGTGRETATDRWARVLTEAGISYEIAELLVETEYMGAQRSDQLQTVIEEIQDVNEGVVEEGFDSDVLRLRSRTQMYNQIPAIVLDYEHPTYGNQAYAVQPTDDDFALRNDWTIERRDGVKAQATLDDGALSVQQPPDGVGRYKDSRELVLAFDNQPADHAGWRLHKGTVDELRYPSIAFRLDRNPELIPAWLACDTGSRLQILNPSDDVGQFTVDQIIEGYVETIDQFEWTVEANCSPASVYNVAVIDTYDGRLDCGGSVLNETLDTTETGVDVFISDECAWGHDHGDYSIIIGGEEMTVTAVGAVSGSIPARTQTLTVIRSVNGVVKTHDLEEEVHVRDPMFLAI